MKGNLKINMKRKASIKTEMRAFEQYLYRELFVSSLRGSLTRNSPSEA